MEMFCQEHVHGTDQEPKYVPMIQHMLILGKEVWNRNMEQS